MEVTKQGLKMMRCTYISVFFIWYSIEGTLWDVHIKDRPVPSVTAHQSRTSALIVTLLYNVHLL